MEENAKQTKHDFLKGALSGALTILLLGGVVLFAMHATGTGFDIDFGSQSKHVIDGDTARKMKEIQTLIDTKYLRESDIKIKDMEKGIYDGYVSGLSDPYSSYYDEKDTKDLQESTAGIYSGIGATLSQSRDTGIITLTGIYKESPAWKAGLQENDTLYKVNGKDISGMEVSNVVSKIRGTDGTEVRITVLRGSGHEEVEVVATRGQIEMHTIEYEMKENQIGYLRITEFDTITEKQYQEALDDLEAQGMKGLVVDLRNNPGGNLVTVCKMLDQMLPKGLIVYTEDKNGTKQSMTSDEEHQFTKPITVLTNGHSASAAEIYAGAIQDYGLGEIVGTTTYGKGVIQQMFSLKDKTCLKLTVAEYFTPKGRNIDGKGIKPDVEIEYENNEQNPEADNQLAKALELVNAKL
ncbi:MAG: S41 family peptidase [Lachnospiraceae bacterium]